MGRPGRHAGVWAGRRVLGTFETEVFAILEDGAVWDRYWDGESWHAWETLGGSFMGQPAASARDANRIDVFLTGPEGSCWYAALP